jgi:uncharacterized membrane protein YdjX (TVP38/TMEM64 family)
MKRLFAFFKTLPQYVHRPWYPYLMALTAFSDYFIFIVPLDAIVVGSIVAARTRWLSISFWSSIGSTLGALLFAEVIEHFGVSVIQSWAPHILDSEFTLTLTHWVHHYGFWALIASAAAPIHQHPTVAIAAIAKISMGTLFITMFIGRFIKYCVYTWLSGHAQNGFKRLFKKK